MRVTSCIKWLWSASCGVRLRVALSASWGVLYVGGALAFVWVSKHLVDIATGKAQGEIWPYGALLAGCIAAQLLFSTISSRIDALNTIKLKNSLKYRLFSRVMESSLNKKEMPHTGDMISRLEEDVRLVTEVLCATTPNVIVTIIQLLSAFVFLLILQPTLAWVIAAIMPIALIISKVYMMRIRKITAKIRDTESKMQSHVQENLQNRTLIQSMECTPYTLDTLKNIQAELTQQVVMRTDFTLFSRILVQGGFMAGYATAFLWGIFGMYEGAVTFGMMTAFLQLVAQVQRPVVELSRCAPTLINSITSIERLAKLDVLPQEQKGEAKWLGESVGIRVQDVDFEYPDGKNRVIKGLTQDFAPGSFTVISGETGAGKSTLIRLMLSLLKPQNGTITLYNGLQNEVVSPMTRCNIVYVPQGNTLLSGTVRENLMLGNPTATNEQLAEVLHIAVADFVLSLPNGLDTMCGENGAGLSEGQAQRIAIARGLLRPGSILLLDEPTAALDNQTEQTLLKRVATQRVGKTIIMITHRETVEKYADNIVEIKKIEHI